MQGMAVDVRLVVLLLMIGQISAQHKLLNRSTSCDLAGAVLKHISASLVPVPKDNVTSPRRHAADGCLPLDKHITLLSAPPAPPPWMELCRQIETQGAAAFTHWMYEKPCDLPDIQGSTGAHCQLGRRPWAHKFQQQLMAAYAAALFRSIVAGRAAAAKQLGAPPPQLSRFDLFHGHFFVVDPHHFHTDSHNTANSTARLAKGSTSARNLKQGIQPRQSQEHVSHGPAQPSNDSKQGQLPEVGILFHAVEYPAFHPDTFPIFLGHCQNNSTCQYHPRAMDLRNILWYKGKLAVLDVGPSSPLHALLHEGTQPLRTVYEEDFGTAVADLLLLKQPYRRRRSLKAAQRLEAQRWHRLIQSQQALAACSADTTGVFVSY